jgi:N6-L-threonylcarbamoyladenine synthase
MIILGIESSCDDSCVALVETDSTHLLNGHFSPTILAQVQSSQDSFHQAFRGVVPEIASRKHLEFLLPLVETCLNHAGLRHQEIDAIAVTTHPGLVGALLMGISMAKSLALVWNKPLISVNHLAAHFYSLAFKSSVENSSQIKYPHVGLLVSGGHTLLAEVESPLSINILGGTIDDACGEAFDKVAKHLGLPHPGGPQIDTLAQRGDPEAVAYPMSGLSKRNSPYDFSYSGLKTAVIYQTEQFKKIENPTPADIAASFQKAAIGILIKKTKEVCKAFHISQVGVVGGVSANSYFKQVTASENSIQYFFPPAGLSTDNAAMIAGLGAVKLHHQLIEGDPLKLSPSPKISNSNRIVA